MSLSSAQSHLSSRSAGRGPRCGAGRPSRGRPVRATTRAVEVAPGPRPRILVIEDDPSVLPFIAACLTRSGYEVVGCQRGDEGLLAALGGQWALVILDLVLPGLPGLDVLRGIAGAHSRVPVMIATGHGTEEAIIAALRLGAVDFLKKPIRVVDLVESVAAAVRRRVHWSLEPTSSQSMRNPDGPPAQVELLDDLSCLSPGNLVLANRRLGVEAALLALAVHHLTTIPVFTAAATAFKELREATPVDAPVLAAAAARRLRLAWAQKFHGHRFNKSSSRDLGGDRKERRQAQRQLRCGAGGGRTEHIEPPGGRGNWSPATPVADWRGCSLRCEIALSGKNALERDRMVSWLSAGEFVHAARAPVLRDAAVKPR